MNLLSRSIKNRPDNGRNQFEAVKVETLYRQMPLVIAGSSFCALVIVILLWQKIPIPSLIGWLCLIGGVAGFVGQQRGVVGREVPTAERTLRGDVHSIRGGGWKVVGRGRRRG